MIVKNYGELFAFARQVGIDAFVYQGDFETEQYTMDDRVSLLSLRADGTVLRLDKLRTGLNHSFESLEDTCSVIRYHVGKLPKDCRYYVVFVPVRDNKEEELATELLGMLLDLDYGNPTLWDMGIVNRRDTMLEWFDHATLSFPVGRRMNYINSEEEYND